MSKLPDLGVYIHWPFCVSKCPYCDFNVFTSTPDDLARWRDGYIRSLRFYAQNMVPRHLVSVYFGGGTPSLMPPDFVGAIIEEAHKLWPQQAQHVEVTLEANPTSSEIGKFQDFKAAGVNRISLGVQSLRDDALKFLGRLHGRDDVLRGLDVTASTFDRYSIDLIYDRPGQSLEDWNAEIDETLPYAHGHISAYQLTIKDGTAFEKQVQRGGFTMSNDDHSADLFELTQERFRTAGMPAYEVSNYGSAGQESRHNLVYWDYDDYIGIGPGAHGRVTQDGRKVATADHRKPKDWMEAVERQGHGSDGLDVLSADDVFDEVFIMNMRLYAGARLSGAEQRSGVAFTQKIDIALLAQYQAQGLVAYDPETTHLRYTKEGMLRSNTLNANLLK